jgi:hypothetical protein
MRVPSDLLKTNYLRMKLSQVKALLPKLDTLTFKLEDGTLVPEHFHVTEIGLVTKKFIDCGGTLRHEQTVNFQLWTANDYEHQLKPFKLLKIIQLSERKLDIEDAEIEVEFQQETIGKYALDFDGAHFILKNKTTACLATDKCGISVDKHQGKHLQVATQPTVETKGLPDGGCC